MSFILFSLLFLAVVTLGAQIVAYNAYLNRSGHRQQSHHNRVRHAVAN
jgi:hypothetical protein